MSGIGVVVLNYGDPSDTVELTESLANATDVHVYVVDNASPGSVGTRLARRFADKAGVSVIQSASNRGYSAGNNLGLKRASEEGCDVLVVTNPDIRFDNGTLAAMAADLADPRIGVVGPAVRDECGIERSSTRGLPTPKGLLSQRRPYNYLFPRASRHYLNQLPNTTDGAQLFAGMVSGCCFAMKSRTYEIIGPLDESTFLYHEEDLLALRLTTAGLMASIDRCHGVIHLGARTTGSRGSAFMNYHRYLSAIYVMCTVLQASLLERTLVLGLNAATFLARAIVSKSYRARLRQLLVWQHRIALGKAVPAEAPN